MYAFLYACFSWRVPCTTTTRVYNKVANGLVNRQSRITQWNAVQCILVLCFAFRVQWLVWPGQWTMGTWDRLSRFLVGRRVSCCLSACLSVCELMVVYYADNETETAKVNLWLSLPSWKDNLSLNHMGLLYLLFTNYKIHRTKLKARPPVRPPARSQP